MDKGRNVSVYRKLNTYYRAFACFLKAKEVWREKRIDFSNNINCSHASPCTSRKDLLTRRQRCSSHLSKWIIQRPPPNIVQWAHMQFLLKLFFLLILFFLEKFTKRGWTLYVTSYKQVCGSSATTLKTVSISLRLQSEYNNWLDSYASSTRTSSTKNQNPWVMGLSYGAFYSSVGEDMSIYIVHLIFVCALDTCKYTWLLKLKLGRWH